MRVPKDDERIVAIICSDLHLSLKPPIARVTEPDWLEAQARMIQQVADMADRTKAIVICPGDVFDRWNSPPELINWAIDVLPHMYAIPGNHDLPLHNYQERKKSAFWTLVQAGKITPLNRSTLLTVNPLIKIGDKALQLVGFPYFPGGITITKLPIDSKRFFNLAVVHNYCWMPGFGDHPGATEEDSAVSLCEKLSEFSAVVVGDNHHGFLHNGDVQILNCGCMIPRTAAEMYYPPTVGLLLADGTIQRHTLNCAEDKWAQAPRNVVADVEHSMELDRFVDNLQNLGDVGLDFARAAKRAGRAAKIDHQTMQIILRALEQA